MSALFQSIAAFFTGGVSNQRSRGSHSQLRRDEAILTVDDAFSIPPETDSVITTKAFTYPPPATTSSYDTVPNSATSPLFSDLRYSVYPRTSKSRPTSLLPMHHSSLPPLPSYPPLSRTWSRIRAWLEQNYPELGDTLNYGIQLQDLVRLELELGQALPQAVRDSYLVTDGQEAESVAGCSEGLFFGLTLLPLEDVIEEWRFWREVDEDPQTGANAVLQTNMQSIPPRWIRKAYSQQGWIPLVTDKTGNYLGIDLNPDEQGASGQVIIFGRDFDTKVVMWRGEGDAGWAKWLASFAEDLENGDGFEIGGGAAEETSDSSEDDVGYESYFFDAAAKSSNGGGGGGGDIGGGGLRLTGDYKHWPVLEALADRSMRKWIEAGVMPPLAHPEKPLPQSSASVDEPSKVIDELDPSASHHPNGDPLSVETNLISKKPVILSSLSPTQKTDTKTKAIVPVSIPKPAPVVLPTEEDILPSPSELQSDEQLERRIDEDMELSDDVETGRNCDSDLPRLTRLQLLDNQSTSNASSSSETLLSAPSPSTIVHGREVDFIDPNTLESIIPSSQNSRPRLEAEHQHASAIQSSTLSEQIPETIPEESQIIALTDDLAQDTPLIGVEPDSSNPFVVSTSSRPNSTSTVDSVKVSLQSSRLSNDIG